jgi:hypothetical protein
MCEVWLILCDKNEKKIYGVYISSVIKGFSCGTQIPLFWVRLWRDPFEIKKKYILLYKGWQHGRVHMNCQSSLSFPLMLRNCTISLISCQSSDLIDNRSYPMFWCCNFHMEWSQPFRKGSCWLFYCLCCLYSAFVQLHQ